MSIELLNKLPKAAQAMWTATSNEAKAKYGESRANKIAWSTIKSKFNKVNETWVAKSSDFNTYEVVRYEFVADEASVSKDSEGFSTIDYILASGKFDGHNQQFGQLALTSMVTQINEEGLVGRLETDGRHELWKQLAKEDLTPEEIEERLQSLDTGIKAISARLDGNKVVAKVKVKSEMLNTIINYNGASVEARFPSEALKGNIINQARLQGFVFTPTPANTDTGVVL